MNRDDTQKAIEGGKTALGIEFGSTRIKAVLIGEDHAPIAAGGHEWENRYENGIWTYNLEDVWKELIKPEHLEEIKNENDQQIERSKLVKRFSSGMIGRSNSLSELLPYGSVYSPIHVSQRISGFS